jgi:hypothetical protein
MYIQRYLPHFPAAGEVVIFDRSWYNRAGGGEAVPGADLHAQPVMITFSSSMFESITDHPFSVTDCRPSASEAPFSWSRHVLLIMCLRESGWTRQQQGTAAESAGPRRA